MSALSFFGVTRGLYNGDPLQYLMRTLPTVQQTELAQTLESVGYAIVPGFVPECPANPTPTDPNTPIDQTNANGRLPTTTQPAVMLAAGALLETSYWEALGMTREAAAMRAGKKCTVEIKLFCSCAATITGSTPTAPGTWTVTPGPDIDGRTKCSYSRPTSLSVTWSGIRGFLCSTPCTGCPPTVTGKEKASHDTVTGDGCGTAPLEDDNVLPNADFGQDRCS